MCTLTCMLSLLSTITAAVLRGKPAADMVEMRYPRDKTYAINYLEV